MNSKRKYKRGICRTLIVVMMVSMMGGVYPMMWENQACAFIRTMNVNDWLEQCRMVAIKVPTKRLNTTEIRVHRRRNTIRISIENI